jgi:hypothetical protein
MEETFLNANRPECCMEGSVPCTKPLPLQSSISTFRVLQAEMATPSYLFKLDLVRAVESCRTRQYQTTTLRVLDLDHNALSGTIDSGVSQSTEWNCFGKLVAVALSLALWQQF